MGGAGVWGRGSGSHTPILEIHNGEYWVWFQGWAGLACWVIMDLSQPMMID